jgi:integrase
VRLDRPRLARVTGSLSRSGQFGEHRVPLCDRAMSILKEMEGKKLRWHADIVFPGRAGRLAADTFFKHLQRMKVGVAAHGFRSSFRDWCADNGKDSELAEWSLAHVTGSGAERAYRRTDALDRRRVLMEQWAEFCGGGAANDLVSAMDHPSCV